jgi:hypothetical protein
LRICYDALVENEELMKTKNSFTQDELLTALNELKKVWDYEKSPYLDAFLTHEDIDSIDKTTVSYGIKLGTLRKIFTEST